MAASKLSSLAASAKKLVGKQESASASRSKAAAAPASKAKAKTPAKAKAPAKVAAKTPAKAKAPAKTPAKAKAPAKAPAAAKVPAAAAAKPATPPSVPRSNSVLGSRPLGAAKPQNRLTKSPYDAKFIDAQRALLLAERERYTRQASVLLAEAESLTADREPGDVQFDEESGEGDTLAVERERDLALSAQALAEVEEIDAALERIDAGVYGICEASGLAIPKERLKAIPWATERVEYKVGGFGRL